MRTKKAVVHGRNSKKRNYVSGSLHSKRNGLQNKRLLRNVTQKRGGGKFIQKTTCEVSGDRFKANSCFIQKLSKLLGEGIMDFLNNENGDESKAKFVEMSDNAKSHYNIEAVKLFNELKRVLFPFLINVMEMREDGKLLSDVEWDLGYNTLVMLIILFNIDQIQYKSIKKNGKVVDFNKLATDLSKKALKKEKKCESELKCVTLSPESISQILIFYFLEGISSEGEASSRFISELKALIESRKQAGGAGGSASVVSSNISVANTLNRVSNMQSEVEGSGVSGSVSGGNPEYVEPPSSTAQPVTEHSPIYEKATQEATEEGVTSVAPLQEHEEATVGTEKEGDESEFKKSHLDRFYSIVFNVNSVEKPKKFIEQVEQKKNKITSDFIIDRVLLFNICKNIFKNFKIGNQSFEIKSRTDQTQQWRNSITLDYDYQLKHSQHLLCVGQIPEYMTEFDVPTQFREKDSKIADLGWSKAEFEKLKLVVFMEPDVKLVTSIQNGGGETPAPGPVPTEEQRQGLLKAARNQNEKEKAKLAKTKEPELHSLIYGRKPEGEGEVAEASKPEVSSELVTNPKPQKLLTSPAPATSPKQQEKVAADPSTASDSGLPAEPTGPAPLPVSTRREKHKIFSIYLRTDEEKLPLNKFCKKDEYFVKYRVPALKLNKFQKSGDTSGFKFNYSLEQSKRMSFSYPVRFGPDFPKYVSLMLNESSYYKALEKGAEDIANLVSKYQRYEEQQKECEPSELTIEEKVFVVDPKQNPGVYVNHGVGFVNPAYTGGEGDETRAFPNPAYESSPDETARLLDMLKEILAKQEGTLDDKAMHHMIYELIYSLRLSESESGGSTAETVALQNTEINRLVEYIRTVETELVELQKQRDAVIEKLSEAMKSQPPGADVTTELQTMADELQRKQAEIDTLSAQNIDLESKVVNLGIDLKKFIDENRELNERVKELETNLRTQAGAFEEKRADLEQQLEEIKAQNDDLNRSNQELTANIGRVTAELSSKDAQVAAKTEECEDLSRQLVEARAQIESLVRERDTDKELLRECLEREQERNREAHGSGADAGEVAEEVTNQALYQLADQVGPPGSEEPKAKKCGKEITIPQESLERIKLQLPPNEKTFYISFDGCYYRYEMDQATGPRPKYLKINYVKEMKTKKQLIFLFDIAGFLLIGDMNEILNHRVKDIEKKDIIKNLNEKHKEGLFPIIYDKFGEATMMTFQLNHDYYSSNNIINIYRATKSRHKTIPLPETEGLKTQNIIRSEIIRGMTRRGGSRTKKLNKINSRNKSKKINF